MNLAIARAVLKNKANKMGMTAEILHEDKSIPPRKGVIFVRFISDHFKGITLKQRHGMVTTALSIHAEVLIKHFIIVHEEYTKDEV